MIIIIMIMIMIIIIIMIMIMITSSLTTSPVTSVYSYSPFNQLGIFHQND